MFSLFKDVIEEFGRFFNYGRDENQDAYTSGYIDGYFGRDEMDENDVTHEKDYNKGYLDGEDASGYYE